MPVLYRLPIFLILLIASAIKPPLAFIQSLGAQARASLAGEIEDNNGKLRLYLTNQSEREFRGTAVIGIGSDVEQRELGKTPVAIAGLDSILLQFTTSTPSGSHYSLRILDQTGNPVFTKIAPIKTTNDPTPATVVPLVPLVNSTNGNGTATPPAPIAGDPAHPAAEVTIKLRLLAGEKETEPFKVLFEITAARPINDAALAIALGKYKDRKPVTLQRDLTVEFKLPEDLDAERGNYVLTAKDGRVLAKGEIALEQMMADDYINVSDIRTDRGSYDFGEMAKLTVVLEGQSPHGYRLEVAARDSNGAIFFTDQRECKPDKHAATQEFSIQLPRGGETPFTFEFKIFDGETGLLFDSGEREIPLNSKKP